MGYYNKNVEVFHPIPRMFFTSCIYRNSSNDFSKSALKYVEYNHGPKNHFIGSCHISTLFKKNKTKQRKPIKKYFQVLKKATITKSMNYLVVNTTVVYLGILKWYKALDNIFQFYAVSYVSLLLLDIPIYLNDSLILLK